jgi:type IV pilus assembly protein PilQ
MKKSTKATGLLFFAVASVYSGHGAIADETAGTGKASPAAQPGVVKQGAAAPADEGRYFSKATASPAAGATAAAPAVVPLAPGAASTDATPVDAPMDPFGQATVLEPSSRGNSVTDNDVAYDGAAGTVEIHVNDANLVEVLRMLSMQSQKNIIASKDVKGTVTANLYGVTVREALDAILTANGYAYKEEGNFVYVYTVQELKAQEQANRVRKSEVIRLYYTPVATAVNMVKPVLSNDGEVAFTDPAKSGLESGAGDVGGNSHSTEDIMVVTDYEDRLDEVRRVIKEIDKRPQQILIEATILRASLSEDNAMGIDFQILGGVDFSGLSAANTTVGAALGGSIVNQAGASDVVNSGYVGGGTGFTGSIPPGGLQLGIVKNNIAVFLEALESVTDTTVLANPKVLALNKQKGEVIVGKEDGYITSTTTDTATVQTVEFLQTGTRLIFRPFIADDGFIRMEIHPEDSSGGLTGANLPFKLTTEVTSNVLVRDGHTVVIGGLFREDSSSTRGQVPGLGNIPFAGALFRNQRDRTTREEIIILLTPHIIKDEAVYSQLSEQELARMDQLRIGVRRGMMMSGRERLAEGFYDSAMSELARPNANRNKALWNLNAATNLNPKFLEAIELKQQITGKQIVTVDNSIARDFVRKLALNDLAREQILPPTAPVVPQENPKAPAQTPAVTPAVAPAKPETPEAVVALAETTVEVIETPERPLFDRATAPLVTAWNLAGFGATQSPDAAPADRTATVDVEAR